MNRDDGDTLDAAGEPGSRGRIVLDSPDTYLSTLPLAHFQLALVEQEIPVSISDDAGGSSAITSSTWLFAKSSHPVCPLNTVSSAHLWAVEDIEQNSGIALP
jgi:hypothetical protein